MNFYIVDDDVTTRTMLSEIIEDHDLGKVIGEAEDGTLLNESVFNMRKVDILLIDLLMPNKDGVETIKDIRSSFKGKIIMISQVNSKELISLAYSHGVEYYIIKPINKIEVLTIIDKVVERLSLEKSMKKIEIEIRNSVHLNNEFENFVSSTNIFFENSILYLLSETGIIGESGHQDLLEVLKYLFEYEQTKTFKGGFPNIKDILLEIIRRNDSSLTETTINREVKASEQRIRRSIIQSLDHLASLGLFDFSNSTFEEYAPKLFNFTLIRQRMNEIKNNIKLDSSLVQINTRKFVQSIYYEAKRLLLEDQLNRKQ